MPKVNETVLEIDLNALEHNYQYITSKLRKSTKVMAVVKAFGYGSDAVEIAKEMVDLGVDYLAVAYEKEGVVLRDSGIKKPILVLHPLPINFKDLLKYCFEPSIYSKKMLKEFISFAEENNLQEFPIHLKFNTGLNRLGFLESDISFISEAISITKTIKVVSLFSHLAASEDLLEKEYSITQIEAFKRISEKMIANLNYKPMLHMCNTSGIFNYPEAHFDMVRSGIGLYGFGNDKKQNKHLKPIASLKTVISQIHVSEDGETVGYNRAFKATSQTRTATLPIGHADGISRAYGNGKSWVTIHGKKAPIIGNVCMDMIMVDVTHIDCKEGDEVIIFDNNHTAEEFAEQISSISYELITAISQRVKRVFYRR